MEKFLIVTDMQRDFIDGALGTDEAKAIVPAVAARIIKAREGGEHVWFTFDTHDERYLDTQEGGHLPVPHCLRESAGWALAPEIERERTQAMRAFEKPVFGSLALMDALQEWARDNNCADGRGMAVELCGVCTDICVITNALLIKTALPEARVSVQAHLCAGVTPARHEAALEVMRSCQIGVSA